MRRGSQPLPRPLKWWLKADPKIDGLIAVAAGLVAFILSFANWQWRINLTSAILNDDKWPTYMQTLSGVTAALLGFGATAVAIVLALAAGRRGQRVLAIGGPGLNYMLARCLGSLTLSSMCLALGGGIKPSDTAVAIGVGLATLLTLTILRLARLWYFLRRLLEVLIIDSADAESRPER